MVFKYWNWIGTDILNTGTGPGTRLITNKGYPILNTLLSRVVIVKQGTNITFVSEGVWDQGPMDWDMCLSSNFCLLNIFFLDFFSRWKCCLYRNLLSQQAKIFGRRWRRLLQRLAFKCQRIWTSMCWPLLYVSWNEYDQSRRSISTYWSNTNNDTDHKTHQFVNLETNQHLKNGRDLILQCIFRL